MTAELGDWLTELGDSEPAIAAEIGAALVAVLIAAQPADLPTLGEPGAPRLRDPREPADYAYQQRLEELQVFRRSVADVATRRRRAELMLEAERRAGADAIRLADLERDIAVAQRSEAQLTEQSQRLQFQVDAFRTAKETRKALYTAAEARLRIFETLEAAGGESDDDLAQLRADVRAAEERLRALLPQSPTAAPGLLELQADPLRSDTRIFLAFEPAETVTLLAVLEGPAISEHGAEAIKLASDLLTEIRADGWPADIDEVSFEDAGAFLARFFAP